MIKGCAENDPVTGPRSNTLTNWPIIPEKRSTLNCGNSSISEHDSCTKVVYIILPYLLFFLTTLENLLSPECSGTFSFSKFRKSSHIICFFFHILIPDILLNKNAQRSTMDPLIINQFYPDAYGFHFIFPFHITTY